MLPAAHTYHDAYTVQNLLLKHRLLNRKLAMMSDKLVGRENKRKNSLS
jgi:hypothetical protein